MGKCSSSRWGRMYSSTILGPASLEEVEVVDMLLMVFCSVVLVVLVAVGCRAPLLEAWRKVASCGGCRKEEQQEGVLRLLAAARDEEDIWNPHLRGSSGAYLILTDDEDPCFEV